MVGGSKSLCALPFIRLELGERRFLEFDVSMEIGLSRFDRLMAEPEDDRRAIDACLQQFHSGGVPPMS